MAQFALLDTFRRDGWWPGRRRPSMSFKFCASRLLTSLRSHSSGLTMKGPPRSTAPCFSGSAGSTIAVFREAGRTSLAGRHRQEQRIRMQLVRGRGHFHRRRRADGKKQGRRAGTACHQEQPARWVLLKGSCRLFAPAREGLRPQSPVQFPRPAPLAEARQRTEAKPPAARAQPT
jgi:hypothetical protein